MNRDKTKEANNQILLSNCHFFNIGFDAFPFMASFLPPTFYFTLFIFYLFENRLAGYIPTISETGTGNPNNSLMITFFCCISASVFYLMRSMTLFMDFYHPNFIEFYLLRIITFVSSIAYILISVFPIDTNPSQHFSSVFAAFFGIILFQLIVLIRTRKDASILLIIWRLISIILQTCPLIICGISAKIWNNRMNVTIQAFSEYSVIFSLPPFFLSYSKDLRKYELIGFF